MSDNDDDDFADAFSTIKPAANPTPSTNLPADLKLDRLLGLRTDASVSLRPLQHIVGRQLRSTLTLPPQPVLDKNGVPRKHAGKIVTIKATQVARPEQSLSTN